MIRLGLRLSLRGAREGKIRLVLTALGVALAVTLLLFTISGFNGLTARDLRNGWVATGPDNRIPSVDESQSDPLWWRLSGDVYAGKTITLVEVGPTGPRSPLLPGMDRLPGPGEYYVSPALAALLDSTPADLLGARFAGTRVGVLGNRLLVSPESLVAVTGRTSAELRAAGDAIQVRSIEIAPKEHSYSELLRVALGIGAIGLMLPVLVFVVTSTRLAAARREERLAALRLVGATPRQVNVVAAVESVLAAVAGTIVGFVLFFAFRPLVACIPFTGERFFTSDLSLGPLAVVGVAVGVPVAAILASLWALRRVQISPLGVTRKAPARPPRAVRLLAPIVGVALLLVSNYVDSSRVRTFMVFVVFAAIALGIMVAGPWLTYRGGRLLGRVARRDSTLIAARRLGSDSRRAFRAISGLVLAVFVGTVFVAIVATAIESGSGTFQERQLSSTTVIQQFEDTPGGDLPAGAATALPAEEATALIASLERLAGVEAVVQVLSPSVAPGSEGVMPGTGYIAETDWVRLGGSRDVVSDNGWVTAESYAIAEGYLRPFSDPAGSERDAATSGGVDVRPDVNSTTTLVILTDGDPNSVERVRTALETALPSATMPYSIGEVSAEQDALFKLLGRMVDVGIILCLVIAGCSLAVSVAGGLVERKRAFALLRLTGMPLRHLYRSVLLEAAVPLVLAAVSSALVGYLVAALIIWSTGGGMPMAAPGAGYFAMVIGGMVAALAIVGATLPLVGRMTEPQSARME